MAGPSQLLWGVALFLVFDLTEILVSIGFSEVAGHISYVQFQPHMEIEMKKLQAVRRTLSGASVEPILAALGEFVDVEELFHIASRHDGYRDGGCIAGQAVSSAVQDLFFGGRGGVYNDVDCFAPAAGHHFESTEVRSRVKTVQMADVVGEVDYEQINARVVPRYRVLSSSRMDKLNLVQIDEYARNKPIELTASILRSFDFNCVQVGIDLVERKLVWTPAFERFLATRQIEVESTHTPAHTAIRLAKKLGELENVYVDQDRVFRTLAGAIMRLKVAEAHTERGKGQKDEMIASLATLGASDPRSAMGTLYGQRRFGKLLAQKARDNESTLSPYFSLCEEGQSGGVFSLEPKRLPDESFLRLASRRHVAEYARLAAVFLRPHKPEVKARAAALLRVDPVSLEPITGHIHIWPAHPSSSVIEMAHEKVSVKEMDRFLAVCDRHRGLMSRVQMRNSLAEQVGVVQVVQKLASEHGQWVYGLIEARADVYGHPFDGLEAYLTEQIGLAREDMLKPLIHRRLRQSVYDGVAVKELVTRAECFQEGEDLHHCIGGYAGALSYGKTVLLSLRSSEKLTSMWSSAEISLDDLARPVIRQHYGPCNSPACEAHQAVLKQVVDDLVAGELVARTRWLQRLSWLGYRVAPLVLRGRSFKRKAAEVVARFRPKPEPNFDPDVIQW